MLKLALSECFPNPLTRQWPSTTSPVTCECQQLYVLVSVCCCVPRAHLLVLHEGEPNNMVTSMPKGPKYVDFQITARTTSEDLVGFLHRAEIASSSSGVMMPSASETLRDDILSDTSLFTPTTPRHSTARRSSGLHSSGGGGSSGGSGVRSHVVVVCLQGISSASPGVRSTLMDILNFSLVMTSMGPKSVPSLRIVAFCDYRSYVSDLPEGLRASFALSTYLSAASMDSAAVLQSINPHSSIIINKRNMLEVMTSSDGAQLVETVTFTSAVSRYFRHLLLVLRGSMVSELAPGTMLLNKIGFFMTLIKVAALLFMPDEVVLRRRTQSGSPVTASSVGTQQQQHRHNSNSPLYSPLGLMSSSTGPQQKSIQSFQHVVVSPGDALCLLPALVSHHYTIHHSVVDRTRYMAAAAERMVGAVGPGALPRYPTHRTASSKGQWDVNMVAMAMRRKPGGDATLMDSASSRPPRSVFDDTESVPQQPPLPPPTVTNMPRADSMRLLHRTPTEYTMQHHGSPYTAAPRGWGEHELSAVPSVWPMAADEYSSAPSSSYLHYGEVRGHLRSTIVCYSGPAPG